MMTIESAWTLAMVEGSGLNKDPLSQIELSLQNGKLMTYLMKKKLFTLIFNAINVYNMECFIIKEYL